MNDYALKLLIQHRHEQILAEIRGTLLPQPEWPSRACWPNQILRLFFPAGETLISNHLLVLDERSGT